MYPLPIDFDSSYLVGKCVEGIFFAEYQVNLNFSDDVILQIEGGYVLELAPGIREDHKGFPIEESRLPSVVGDVVKALEFDRSSGDMTISFAKGALLHVRGDSGPYESYRLTSKDGDIVV